MFRNDSGRTIYWKNHTIEPGGLFTPMPNTYSAAVPEGLTRIAECPTPWVVFDSEEIPHTFTGLHTYPSLLVRNMTDVDIRFIVNGNDTELGILVEAGTGWPINQSFEVTSLTVTSEDSPSSGLVELVCTRRF